MIKIPGDDRRFHQSNKSSILGNISESFGIDLSRDRGKINFSKSTETTNLEPSTQTSPNYGTSQIQDFAMFDPNSDTTFGVGGGTVWKGTFGAAWSEPSWTNLPTGSGDTAGALKVFNDKLYLLLGSELSRIDSVSDVSWNTISTSPAAFNKTMDVFNNRLYLSSQQKVFSIDTAETIATTGTYTIDLDGFPEDNAVEKIIAASNRIWILTEAAIYEWDGVTENTPTAVYPMEYIPLSGVLKNDILYILDSAGRLMRQSGSTFVEVARFPFVEVNTGLVQRNGMDILPNGNIVMNIDGRSGINNLVWGFRPGGIWEYDEQFGLFHRCPNSHTSEGNQPVFTDGVGAIIASRKGKGTDTLDGDLLWSNGGVREAGDSSGKTSNICVVETKYGDYEETGVNISYFVTSELHSFHITDNFEKVFAKFKPFQHADDEIEIKYRLVGETKLPKNQVNITWTNDTTFTTTDSDFSTVEVGDEIFSLAGTAAGLIAHITSIEESGGTYTVVIDRTKKDPSTANTSSIYVEKWKKLKTIDKQGVSFAERRIGKIGTMIQLKVVFYHNEPNNELHQIILENNTEVPIK